MLSIIFSKFCHTKIDQVENERKTETNVDPKVLANSLLMIVFSSWPPVLLCLFVMREKSANCMMT